MSRKLSRPVSWAKTVRPMNITAALSDSGRQRPKFAFAVQVDYAHFDAQHVTQLSVTAKSQFNVGTAVIADMSPALR